MNLEHRLQGAVMDVWWRVLLGGLYQLGAVNGKMASKVQGMVQMSRRQVGISCRESQYRGAEVVLMKGESRRMEEESEGRKIDGR